MQAQDVKVYISERVNPKRYEVWVDDPRYIPTHTTHTTVEQAKQHAEYERRRTSAPEYLR